MGSHWGSLWNRCFLQAPGILTESSSVLPWRAVDPISEMKDFMWSGERKGKRKRRGDQENEIERMRQKLEGMELERRS